MVKITIGHCWKFSKLCFSEFMKARPVKRKKITTTLRLEEVRKQIIDQSLVVSSILGTLAFGLSIIGRLNTGFHYVSIIELAVLASLVTVTLNRNKLSNDIKTNAIIILLILFSLSDSFHFGLFSSARLYLVLIPFFAIFYFSLTRALFVFFISLALFLLIGYLHHLQILTIPETYIPDIYILRVYPWIINAVHISIVGSIILLITRKFLNAYSGMIADLEESNKRLSESERNYREIFNSTNEAIFLHNASDGRILDVNDVMLRMYGIENKEKALNLKVKDITNDKDGKAEEKLMELLQKAIEEGPQVFEWESRKLNGELFFSEISLKSTEKENYGRVLAVVRDVTERKLAQKALEESERKFREMAELLPETVWECDITGKITFMNNHGIDKFGYTEEEILKGYNILDSVIPGEREKARINLNRMLEKERGSGEDFTVLKSDGTTFPVTMFTSVIRRNNNPVGYRGIIIDISGRKKALQDLRESEARYRTIIDAFPDIIMISDLKGNIIFGNNALEKLTGITQADYRNPNRKPQIHPDDLEMVGSLIADLISGERQHSPLIENRFIDASGKTRWFSGIVSKLYIEDQLHLQTITRDVTSKKLAEDQLEQYKNNLEKLIKERTEELEAANEELSSANEVLYSQREELQTTLNKLHETFNQLIQSEKMASLGTLAAGIAHEINNPLNFIKTGILGLHNYLEENLSEHIEPLKPMTNGILTGVERATNIVSSLKHYARNDDAIQTQCDIHAIIEHCLVMLQNQFKYKVEVIRSFSSDPPSVMCNEGKLHQVFLNILANAGQSIREKGTIEITTRFKKNQFLISIKDSGIGISRENLKKVTDPFFTTKDAGMGIGLGLSITQNIIKEHQGTLEFKSKPGIGTEAIISLPLQRQNNG